MATKIFLDTNIFLDLLDGERQHHSDAIALFEIIENGQILAYTSESVITTLDYIVRKLLSASKSRDFISEILKNAVILPCNNVVISKAMQIDLGDLEDAILYQIAIENRLDYFITEDLDIIKKMSSSLLPGLQTRVFLKKISM